MSFPSNPTNGQTALINGQSYNYSSTSNSWSRVATVAQGTTITSVISVISTASATSTSTGALVVAGGLGVGGNGYFGGNIYMGGALVATTATATTVPKISSIQITSSTYVATSATAVSNTGGYIVLNGSGFVSGAQVIIGTKSATSIGFVNANQLQVQVPAQTNGTYIVYVTNPDGGVAINVPGLTYNDFPVWSSGSTLAQQVQGNAISLQLAATDSTGTVTYSLASGSSLPPGLSLSSSGLLSGTVTGLSVTTVYNFTINAVDIYTQATAQAFTVTISVGDTYWPYTTLLLNGDGTNAATNNTFVDSSSNALTITKSGSPGQGSFSPYGTLWSNYFNGSTDYQTFTAPSGFNTSGNFTLEGWVNLTSIVQSGGSNPRILVFGGGGSGLQIVNEQTNNNYRLDINNAAVIYSANNTAILGAWQHFAVVRSGSTITFYVNGNSVGTTTNSSTITNSGTCSIGDYPSGSGYLNGYLSNIRFVVGTAVYTGSFTPPISPLTAISNTQLLIAQSNRYIDNSTNNLTITPSGSVSVQRFSPFTSGTSYSASTIGGSGYLNGSSDYLTASSNSAFAFGAGAFTVEFWIYPTANFLYFASPFTTGSTTNDFVIDVQTTGLSLDVNNNAVIITTSSIPLTLNSWNHVAVSRGTSGSTLYIFINGQIGASVTNSTSWTNTGNVTIGKQLSSYVPGYITDLRVVKGTQVYSSAFTPPTAPISAITNTSLLLSMQNAGIVDSAMMNDFVTVGSAQISTSVKKYGTGSLSFNGTTDYLTSKAVSSVYFQSGNWTVEFWVNFNSFSGAQVFVNFGYENTSTRSFIMYVVSGFYQIAQSPDGSTNYDQTLVATSLSTGTWYHFAYVRNSGTITFYINGTAQGTATAYSLSTIPTAWSIGSQTNASFLNGYIDDLRITKGIARYTTNFTPSATAFVGQ